MIISARVLKLIPKQVCSQKIYIYSTSSEITVLISQKVVSLMLKGSIFYSVSPGFFFIIGLNTENERSVYLCICWLPD